AQYPSQNPVTFSPAACDNTSKQITASITRDDSYAFSLATYTAHGEATAAWGALGFQMGVFPITVGNCSFTGLQLGTLVTLHSYAVPGCDNPSGNFGFLANGCTNINVQAGDTLPGTPGNNLQGTGCTKTLDQYLNTDVLVPVWDVNSGTGAGESYHIISFALFQITARPGRAHPTAGDQVLGAGSRSGSTSRHTPVGHAAGAGGGDPGQAQTGGGRAVSQAGCQAHLPHGTVLLPMLLHRLVGT